MYGLVSRFLVPNDVRACLDDVAPSIGVRDDDTVAVSGTASVDMYLADLFG
jgi:hypothetical protein